MVMLDWAQILIIKFITPLVWHFSPKRRLQALLRFSAIEKDSGVRLMQYSSLIKNTELKALIFEHAIEEFEHAALFDGLIKKTNSFHKVEIKPKKFMLDDGATHNEIIKAYAYAFVGESVINKNFYYYESLLIDTDLRKVFNLIAAEEQEHAQGTDSVLLKLCQNDFNQYNREIRAAKLKRFNEELSSVFTYIGGFFLMLTLKMLYYVAGPFCFMCLKNRFNFSEESELQIFKKQIADTEASK